MDGLTILEASGAIGNAGFCPHEPTDRQKAFLELDCLEALYGGAAGGGKSDALLMAALQYVHIPGYSALLLRRTYADLALPEAIMDRSKTWLMGSGAQWNDRDKRWTFPSGATLTFGYLDNDRDRYRYQSAAFQFIGWDELTQFPESWYLYLFSRLRRLQGVTVPMRIRGGTNPGGIGHKRVKKRFVDPATATGPFVPSLLADNPHVDADAYRLALAQLDPTTRLQLEHGKWVQDSSGLVYGHFDRSRNVRPMPPIDRQRWRFTLGLDFGFTDATAFVVIGWEQYSNTVWIIYSEKKRGMTPSDVAERVTELDAEWHFDRIVGDIGGLGKGYAEEMRQRWQIPIKPAEKNNKQGYIKLFNGGLASGDILVVDGQNDELITEWEDLPWSDEEHSKEAEGFDNHLADAALYDWREAKAWNEGDAPRKGATPGTPAYELAKAQEMKEQAIQESLKRAKREGKQLMRRYR